jgi:hypothetical protein
MIPASMVLILLEQQGIANIEKLWVSQALNKYISTVVTLA